MHQTNRLKISSRPDGASYLCQYVKERLSRMQSHACMSYAEAMVFFEAKPQGPI